MDEPRHSAYREAGVDIDVQDRALAKVKELVRGTYTAGVLGDLGGFGALFRADWKSFRDPVLVSSVDGVGTKLKIAFAAGVHDSVGCDLVCHCVNDILVMGAQPLFFLDYFATGRLEEGVMLQVISGLARGCRENGLALIGGETAEMPGFFADGEYDIAGFIVGVAERKRLLDGKTALRAGDVAIGLPSAGLHTNGYSLARKILLEDMGLAVTGIVPGLGISVAEALLKPHLSYSGTLAPLLEKGLVKALAHITGGGFTDNIPRVLPVDLDVNIKVGSWEVLPVFKILMEHGRVTPEEMFRVFNMGIGMVLFVSAAVVDTVVKQLQAEGQHFFFIGNVVPGSGRVQFDWPPAWMECM